MGIPIRCLVNQICLFFPLRAMAVAKDSRDLKVEVMLAVSLLILHLLLRFFSTSLHCMCRDGIRIFRGRIEKGLRGRVRTEGLLLKVVFDETKE